MRKITIASVILPALIALALALPPSPAHAVSAATWVSGSGSDTSNNCSSQATPCREINTALGNTSPAGTVHVLPGDYGSVHILQAIEIIADQGGATISEVCYPVNGGPLCGAIVVAAGASDVVRIRGISINETGTNFACIVFASGKALHLENCTLIGTGIGTTTSLHLVPSIAATGSVPVEISVRNSTIGPNIGTGNVLIAPSNGVPVAATFDNVHMVEGLYGIRADTSNGSGLIRVDVRNSLAKGNANNGYLAVGTGASPIHFMIDHSTAENNGVNGAVATGSQAFMIVTNSTLMGNGTGLLQQSGATVASTGTNTINFNTTNTSGTITPIPQK